MFEFIDEGEIDNHTHNVLLCFAIALFDLFCGA